MFFNKKKYKSDLPDNIVLLITHQRAGSTWLFDICQALPFCNIHPAYIIFNELGLITSRRYPVDLSQNNLSVNSDGQIIEVLPNKWERINSVNSSEKSIVNLPTFFVEKLHPHFATSWNQFLKKFNRIYKNKQVKIIIHIRNPEDSIDSFFKYQKRNPSWYPHIDSCQLINFFREEYEKLLYLYETYECMLITYQDLTNNFQGTVTHMINYILDNKVGYEPAFKKIISRIEKLTCKTNRLDNKSNFFASKSPNIKSNMLDTNNLQVVKEIFGSFADL